METVITPALLARLRKETEAAPDREICGLLFGTLDRIEAAEACANVAADPTRAFEIDPVALLRAHKAARAGGPPILGCYHSHPSGSAEPSDHDRAAAEPGRLWLILAAEGARLWAAGLNTFAERSLLCVE